MKKYAVVLAMAFFIPVTCFAQEQGNVTGKDSGGQSMFPPSAGQGKCPFMQQKGMDGGMDGMGMMMKRGRQAQGGSGIAASDKGGVIVLSGGYLYKFDKDLNLVKKVPVE